MKLFLHIFVRESDEHELTWIYELIWKQLLLFAYSKNIRWQTWIYVVVVTTESIKHFCFFMLAVAESDDKHKFVQR